MLSCIDDVVIHSRKRSAAVGCPQREEGLLVVRSDVRLGPGACIAAAARAKVVEVVAAKERSQKGAVSTDDQINIVVLQHARVRIDELDWLAAVNSSQLILHHHCEVRF